MNLIKRLLGLLLAVMLLASTLPALAESPTGYMETAGKFYLDYATLAEEQEAAEELAILIAQEGMVLLKNEGNALPLSKNEKRVSLFGTGSYNLVHSGSGSGAGSVGNQGIAFKTLTFSLETAGFKLNQTLVNLYGSYAGEDKEMPVSYLTNTITSTYRSYFN